MAAAELDVSTATIDVDTTSVNPRHSPEPAVVGSALAGFQTVDRIVYNLTIGYNPDPEHRLFAFKFTGKVNAKSGDAFDFKEWTFGFVQLIRLGHLAMTYQGRKPEEGHVLLDPEGAIGPNFMLDLLTGSGPRRVPFYMKPFFSIDDGVVTTTMGDHPTLDVPDRIFNQKTGTENYLFQAAYSMHAISIFTAQTPAGKFLHLAHVPWFLTYSAKFRWQGSKLALREDAHSFTVNAVAKGPPQSNADANVGGLLAKLGPATSPIFNDRLNAEMKRCFAPKAPRRRDNEGGLKTVPPDFWQ
jgi:hypothetical protein